MAGCTGKKKNGEACGMRPKAGETECRNHKAKSAETPAPAAEERALMPGEEPGQASKKSAGSAAISNVLATGTAGEVIAGVLLGFIAVAGAAWAILGGSKKAKAS